MIALEDVDILGVFVTPAAVCLIAAFVICSALRRLFDLVRLERYVWNRALFDLCVLVCLTDLLVLSLRSGGG